MYRLAVWDKAGSSRSFNIAEGASTYGYLSSQGYVDTGVPTAFLLKQ